MNDTTFGAVVVLYHPDASVVNNIRKLIQQLDYLVVVDNSEEKNENHHILLELYNEYKYKVRYIYLGLNLGIAEAMNIGCKFLIEEKMKFILTFDQDTALTKDYVTSIYESYNELSKYDQIGIVGPKIIDVNSEGCSQKYFTILSKWRFKFEKLYQDRSDLGFVISSGSLIPSSVMLDVGLFRSEFFIDGVDVEYCLRLKINNYRVAYSDRAQILHSMGEKSIHNIMGKKIVTSNHSDIRRYYMIRNSIYIISEYGVKLPFLFVFYFGVHVNNLIRIMFFERNRSSKIKYSILGFWHGIKGIKGKLK
ncbi:glycosyltransferase family 2 protein [Vibrio breoganii]